MSDNLPPEVVRKELEARLRIPTEVWTDVFKLLPRRVLVQQVAPACYYFNEISNKNVKSIHVIVNADQFTKKLENGDPEAKQKLELLAANDCKLSGQFRLTYLWISEKGQNFQQSRSPSDRRRFVLSISALSDDEITELDHFERHENQKTGEVLLLEPAGDRVYRYRRCLAEEVANGEEFYAKTFDRNISLDEFVGNDAPLVEIQNG